MSAREIAMGAGVIPFCVHGDDVCFLLHKTFTGRRAGCLVDFGGGAKPGETHVQTAVREFVEETESMFFCGNPADASPGRASFDAQAPLVRALFDRTLADNPDWWCSRADSPKGKRRDWKTFFIEFEYRDVTAMNREWASDVGRRFAKRRELVWVPASILTGYYRHTPEKLWKRVRELRNATETVQAIVECMQARAGLK